MPSSGSSPRCCSRTACWRSARVRPGGRVGCGRRCCGRWCGAALKAPNSFPSGLHPPPYTVEGDGTQVIDEQRVSVMVDHRFAELPSEIKPWVGEIAAEQAARKRRGEQSFWNGPTYAVVQGR